MKKIFPVVLLMSFSSIVSAWDFGIKGNLQGGSTSNVNLTSTNELSDTYKLLGGYAQIKNEEWKFKLRAKGEKYTKETVNDNYSGDLSAQYKGFKDIALTVGVFKVVYNGKNLINTDTTSDNTGGRFEAIFNQKYSKDTSGYFTLYGNYKNYSKIAERKDKIFGGNYGIDHNISPKLLLNAELILQQTSSSDSYYSNFTLGPFVELTYSPTDKWDLFVDGSYNHTTYSGRTVTTTTLRPVKVSTKDEYQNLTIIDAGIGYNFTDVFTLQGKYSKNKNVSNNSTSAYKANIVSLDFSARI
ncbi:MAG: TonB-dependent receptor [Rhizobacter sp.]|nr:TonB-dependent receptor [Bacteriovorax sp.]